MSGAILFVVALPLILALSLSYLIQHRMERRRNRIAHFTGAFECADCGLDLTGRTVWECPQCGAEIMRLLRVRGWPPVVCVIAALLSWSGLTAAVCPTTSLILWLVFDVQARRGPLFWLLCIGLAAMTMAYPATTLLRLLYWRYVVFDGLHCFDCGYDLHGNLSGTCPECGTAIPVTDDIV